MEETIDKVHHDLTFAYEGLREALKRSTSVESIILVDMVGKAASLMNEVSRFRVYREIDMDKEPKS